MKNITQHGTGMYRYRGCRCGICREAIRVQKNKYRPKSDNKNIKLDARALLDRLERDGRLWLIERSKIRRWLENGISIYTADEICIRLGYHPSKIWGQSFYAGCFDEDYENV